MTWLTKPRFFTKEERGFVILPSIKVMRGDEDSGSVVEIINYVTAGKPGGKWRKQISTLTSGEASLLDSNKQMAT